jgi:hypothetical protein
MRPEMIQEKLEATAGIDTELKSFLADYARAMSGATVPETERQMYREMLGIDFGTQPDVAIAKLKGFANAQREAAKNKALRLGGWGYGGSALDVLSVTGDIKIAERIAQESPKAKPAPKVGDAAQQAGDTPKEGKFLKSKFRPVKMRNKRTGKIETMYTDGVGFITEEQYKGL